MSHSESHVAFCSKAKSLTYVGECPTAKEGANQEQFRFGNKIVTGIGT